VWGNIKKLEEWVNGIGDWDSKGCGGVWRSSMAFFIGGAGTMTQERHDGHMHNMVGGVMSIVHYRRGWAGA